MTLYIKVVAQWWVLGESLFFSFSSNRIFCKFLQFHCIKLHKYPAYSITFFKKTCCIIKDSCLQQSQKTHIFLEGLHYTVTVAMKRLNANIIGQWPSIGAGRLFVAPKLLFLHHVFWLGRHVYTATCLHAKDTQRRCYWATHCCCFLTFTFVFGAIHMFAFCRLQEQVHC